LHEIQPSGITSTNAHDVQYITWDHNCVIMAGLMSDNTRSICREVRKFVKSTGDGAGAGSWNIEDNGGVVDCPRARFIVSLNDEKPREVDDERED